MDKTKPATEDAAMSDLVKEFNYDETLDKQFDHNDVAVKKKKPFPCLPDKEPARPTIPITRLLSVVSVRAKVLMVVGSLAAAAQGVVFPAFSVVFGNLFNVFFTQTPDQIRYSASIIAGVFCALAVYNFVMGYLGQACWGLVGEEVGNHFRKQFFLSVLRQEVGYFDNKSVGSLTSMLNTNIEHIRAGTGSKVGMWMMFFSQALVGVIIAFVYSWKLTLVLIAISPLMGLGSVMQMRILAASTQSQAGAFQQATNLAIEVISGFSTVASFVWEPHARDRYLALIDQTKKPRARTAHVAAIAFGLSFAFIFLCYALGFWYGAQLVADGFPPANATLNGTTYPPGYVAPGGISVGDMLIVFFSVIMGAMGLGQMFSVNPDFAACRASAYDVIQVINRVSKVDPNPNGVKNVELKGEISFRNVRFTFPARPGEEVIHGLTLDIPAGTIVGIVGHSGAGKSTLISLVERFYDCDSGTIFVDNVPLKDYDLHWLRGNIGLVSQEPILFDGTIADNIRFGKTDATMEEVIEAAKMANAHSFIEKLPHGYDTPCGQGGSLLSGGQKQRVAIARAVLKNPRIILLDEATSALDAESEHLVQDALQKLMHGRTTLVVAHRLSTIRDSDIIVVMDKGYIVEMGKHLELLMKRGFYYSLIARQMDTEDLKQINQMAASMSSFFASQTK